MLSAKSLHGRRQFTPLGVLTMISKCERLRHHFTGPGGHVDRISSLIGAAEQGDNSASDALFSTLYSELHRIARRELARQGAPMSLSATTVLHEAYLDMAGRDGTAFPDRGRFMGYAARV